MALDDLGPRDRDVVAAVGTQAAGGRVVLQHIPLDRAVALRALYWRGRRDGEDSLDAATPDGAGGICVAAGATLSFDTYFGAMFEQAWRLYTSAGLLTLSVELSGPATLRIWRRTALGACLLLHEAEVPGAAEVTLPADVTHFRQAGLLWFDVTARLEPVTVQAATWSTVVQGEVSLARLGVVICTYNREGPLGVVLDGIAEAGLEAAVERVIVVNQGAPGLREHAAVAGAAQRLGGLLNVVEQPNFGGAGGFCRGLLEALDDARVTHVCFLDDDVRLEAESLRRMAAFFTLTRDGVALGGHMLDGISPTTLYEAGAVVLDNWALQPLNHGVDLQGAEALGGLLDVKAMHYNGWWMFAFDKRLVERVGMPLPCFIRGDDVEFGMRLHEQGVSTVPLPGVGIWHEPFYLKLGGWQLYYETRNALICAALHQDFGPRRVAVLMVKRLLLQLLTFRYYGAALIVRAAEDFLQGPAILDRDPRPLHASLGALRTQFPEETAKRERVLAEARVGGSPSGRLGFVVALAWAVGWNWVRRSAGAQGPRRMLVRDLVWFRVRADALAVDTYWDRDLPVLRRDRAAYRGLLRQGARAIWRLYRAAPGLRRAWSAAMPRMSSVGFWREYLQRR